MDFSKPIYAEIDTADFDEYRQFKAWLIINNIVAHETLNMEWNTYLFDLTMTEEQMKEANKIFESVLFYQ